MSGRRFWIVSAAIASLLVGSVARADEAAGNGKEHRVRKLHYAIRIEPFLTLAAAGSFATAEVLRNQLAPGQCRWCRQNRFDQGIQDNLVWSNTTAARRLSDWTGFIFVPGFALGGLAALSTMDEAPAGMLVDAAVVLESTLLALNLTSWTKLLVGRQRPFLYRATDEDGVERLRSADDNLSFFSGHTSLAFSMGVSAAMVASLRDYRWAPVLWATGVPLAALTGYLRIAGDRHFLSDVVVGAVAGTLSGLLIPWLHREDADKAVVGLTASSTEVSIQLRL